MQPTNPFIIEGYVDDRYFCDRETESRTLSQALASGRNVTLISPRRMGKSGLIHHVFHRERDKGVKCFYIDIFHTHCLNDFIEVFANAIFGAFDTPLEKFYANVVKVLRHCRPTISPDSMTGMPMLSLNIVPGHEQHTLKEIFDYLASSGERIYIAFDEFQQIAEYPEKGVEALLRSFIQFTPNVNFVFAGSKKHLMQQMFQMPSRPFYQSTQNMTLKPIPFDLYFQFATRLFQEAGKDLSQEAFEYIYDSVYGHTWYVQYWLSRLFDNTECMADMAAAEKVLDFILKEEDDNFYAYIQLLTDIQVQVIKGIAAMGLLTPPITQAMVEKYSLPSASSVRSSLKSLEEKEVLLKERDSYFIYNRFLMLWLRHHWS